VLRQLGHDVIAMEDMTAGAVAPLGKVFEMVDSPRGRRRHLRLALRLCSRPAAHASDSK
jgi:hypothetical protein